MSSYNAIRFAHETADKYIERAGLVCTMHRRPLKVRVLAGIIDKLPDTQKEDIIQKGPIHIFAVTEGNDIIFDIRGLERYWSIDVEKAKLLVAFAVAHELAHVQGDYSEDNANRFAEKMTGMSNEGFLKLSLELVKIGHKRNSAIKSLANQAQVSGTIP